MTTCGASSFFFNQKQPRLRPNFFPFELVCNRKGNEKKNNYKKKTRLEFRNSIETHRITPDPFPVDDQRIPKKKKRSSAAGRDAILEWPYRTGS